MKQTVCVPMKWSRTIDCTIRSKHVSVCCW